MANKIGDMIKSARQNREKGEGTFSISQPSIIGSAKRSIEKSIDKNKSI